MSDVAQTVRVPQGAWSGDFEATLDFPTGWDVAVCPMEGHDAPPLDEAGFRAAFASPVGSPPIRELARGKRRVVVLFDDLSRPTKIAGIAPYVIEELVAGGVDEEEIQFICALGAHGAHYSTDFRQKLGDDVVARFNVYNHNCYENCTAVGTTSRGTPVELNREFMEADLKIGIGLVCPHVMSGFGGGGKIVLPGVASLDTIQHNHVDVPEAAKARGVETDWGMGRSDKNPMLADIREACRMSGLDVKIDALVNVRRDTVALVVGAPDAVFEEGVRLARPHYLSPRPEDAEVVVTNANAKVNEAGLAMAAAPGLLAGEGGTVVLVSNNPTGIVRHYFYGSFGNHTGGRQWNPKRSLHPRIGTFIVQMPWPDKASFEMTASAETATLACTWRDVVAILKATHPNGAKVAVVPDGTIQYFGDQ